MEAGYLIKLAAAFLRSEPAPNPPESFDEQRFLAYARAHKMTPIAAFMLEKTDFLSPPARAKLEKAKQRHLWIDTLQLTENELVNQAFSRKEIDYVPLKGAILKHLYPETWLRPMADYDILVREADFDRAERVLLGELKYNRDGGCEHNNRFLKPPGFELELHRKLMSNLGGFRGASEADWSRFTPVSEGSHEYRFSNEDFYRFLIEHLMKHWVRCQGKLRQIVDIALYRKKMGKELNRAKLEEMLKQDGTLEFARNIELLISVWFDGASASSHTNKLTDFLFKRGEVAKWDESLAYSIDLEKLAPKHPFLGRVLFLFRKLLLPEKARPSRNHRIASAPTLFKVPLMIGYWFAANLYVFTHASYYKRFFQLCSAPDKEVRAIQELQKEAGIDLRAFKKKQDDLS